jgi:hypothetical protein
VTHENQTRERIDAERTPRRSCLGLVAWLAAAGSGCDIVQGYQDTGDALFPEQSTHLASPGLRLARGNYTQLGVVAGEDVYLLAREADDASGKLISMRYAEPRPCEMQGIGRFSATSERGRRAPLLSYFEEDVRRGTLHFADATCKRYALSFEDARLPIAETEKGLVVWAGSDLWLATPETESRELLASGVSSVIRRVFGRRWAVVADGRLAVFDGRWQPQGTFGAEVGSVVRAGDSVFYLDGGDLHRIVASEADANVVEDELLIDDACALSTQDGTWLTVQSPCEGGKLMAIHEPTGRTFTLPFDADPSRVKLVPARKSPGRDPLVDPFWFFYLRSGDSEGSEDSLFVRTPAGVEHALGTRATLRKLRLLESESETHGCALIDVAGETGRYVWWNEAGETRVVAENVMWRPDRLIVDFDGIVGSVAVASGDSVKVLAERVPWDAFEYQDGTRQWTVLFHDMQEQGAGKLSVFREGIDELESAPPEPTLSLPELSTVASNVIVFGTSSLDEVLSGVTYLTDFDRSTFTGRLEYRNLELRFTARINEGVSSYVVGYDEILYTIPYGDDAGIWLASAK